MASVKPDTTIRQYREFVREVYGLHNDRHFGLWDMLSNVQRFAMRGIKGIRKQDSEKIRLNVMIAFSWFTSILNRLHIDLEDSVWKRFPYMCSYCASCPCACRERGVIRRQKVQADDSKRPKTLEDFQKMFSDIYPPQKRTLEHAGIHLAEEIGEFSEAILAYRGKHSVEHFHEIAEESADVFSCILGIFSSLGKSLAGELSATFSNNCHACHNSPCTCDFAFIMKFES